MNILKIQDDLKNFSQQQLVTEMQRPSGNVPQFLVLSELSRRKRMQTDQARAEAANTPTVAQEAVAAAGMPMGGVTQMAQAMAPKTSMTENTGIAAMMPKQPTRMVEGGVVKMQTAGQPEDALEKVNKKALAELKRLYPEVYEQYKDSPRELLYIARQMLEVAKEPKLTGLEQMEKPRTNFQKLMDFARYSPLKGKKNMEKIEEEAEERDTQARIDTANALRRRNQFYVGEDPIFNDGGYSEQLKGTGVPVPLPSSLRNKIQTSIPNNMSGPSVQQDLSVNTSNIESELGPMFPQVSSNTFAPVVPNMTKPKIETEGPDMSGVEKDMDRDELLKALRDPKQHTLYDTIDFLNTPAVRGDGEPGYKRDLSRKSKQRFLSMMNNPQNMTPPMLDLFFPQGADELQSNLTNVGDETRRAAALEDLNRRALQYYNTDTYQPPSEVYPFLLGGDPRAIAKFQGESPEEVQAVSDRLYNEATKDEAAKEQAFFTADDNLQQSVFDEAIAAQNTATARAKLYDSPYLVQLMRKAENQIASKKFDDENEGVGSEPVDFEKIDKATEEKNRQEAAEQQANAILDQLKTDSEKTSAATSKADLSLSEYIKGLDKDRESSKWLAVARMGAELMKPSATIGEGIGKAVSVGAKDLQEGKKAYNKSKLTVLGLQARIDAAKAKSGALTTNQRLTQGLKFQEEARKLEEAARLSNPPDLNMLEQAKAFNITAQQLLGMPSLAQSSVVKAPSAT